MPGPSRPVPAPTRAVTGPTCSPAAHAALGWCGDCPGVTPAQEALAWRVLAETGERPTTLPVLPERWGAEPPRTCGVYGQDGARCLAPVRAGGMCEKHYRRWLRHGDPAVTVPRGRPPAGRVCSTPGCGRPHYGLGLCEPEYQASKQAGKQARRPDPERREKLSTLWTEIQERRRRTGAA